VFCVGVIELGRITPQSAHALATLLAHARTTPRTTKEAPPWQRRMTRSTARPPESEPGAERRVCYKFSYTGQEHAPYGRAPPPVTESAHSGPGPPDHGLRAALRAVLGRAAAPATGDGHTRAARVRQRAA
jgi:hypothetical protein